MILVENVLDYKFLECNIHALTGLDLSEMILMDLGPKDE
jgi:hypothetical protein